MNSIYKVEDPMARNRSKWGHPVSALCIGVGVGAVLGILFAPKSGEEIRDDIANTVPDGVDEVRARAAKTVRGARRFVNDAKERIDEAVEAGTEAYRESMRSVS